MNLDGFLIFTLKEDFGLVYKLYSADCKKFYGDFYTPIEIYNKVSAIRSEGVCL